MSARPKCPNHQCEMQFTGTKRLYQCPVSDAIFECDVDEQKSEKKFDKFGNPIIEWKIEGDESTS